MLMPTFTDVHHSDTGRNLPNNQRFAGFLPILSPCKKNIFITADGCNSAAAVKELVHPNCKRIGWLMFSHLKQHISCHSLPQHAWIHDVAKQKSAGPSLKPLLWTLYSTWSQTSIYTVSPVFSMFVTPKVPESDQERDDIRVRLAFTCWLVKNE